MMRVSVGRPPGPGLLESVHEAVLECELTRRGLGVIRQAPLPVIYEGMRVER